MITYLKLTNFKGHTLKTEIGPGLTLITGPNYSGKSRLLQGIMFALWGSSPSMGGEKRLPTRGTQPVNVSSEIRFTLGSAQYKVVRTLSDAYLYLDGNMIASGRAAVSRELEEAVGISSKLFSTLKYSAQGKTQALLTMGFSQIHQILETVSGANLVSRVLVRTSDLISSRESVLTALGDAPDLQAAILELNGARDSLEAGRDTLRELAERRQEAAALVDQLSTSLASLRALWTRKDRLVREREGLEQQAAAARERMRKEAERSACRDSLDQEIEDATNRLQSAEKVWQAVRDAEKEATRLDDQVCSLTADRDFLALSHLQAVEAWRAFGTVPDSEGVALAIRKVADLVAEKRRLTEQVKDLQRALDEGVCPACNRAYEAFDRLAVEADLEEAEDALRIVRDELKEAKTDLDKLTDRKQKGEALERSVMTLTGRLKEAEDRLGEAVGNRYWAESALKDAFQEGERIIQTSTLLQHPQTMLAAIHNLQEARDALVAEKATCDEARASAKVTEEQVKSLNRRLGEVVNELFGLNSATAEEVKQAEEELGLKTLALSEVKDRETEVKEEVGRLDERVRHLSGYFVVLSKKAKSIEQASKERAVALGLTGYLRKNRDRFMEALWTEITEYASDFARQCTGGVIEAVSRGSDGRFYYTEGGVTDDVISASGAQQSIMSVGVQLALDLAMRGSLGVMLLDEPTSDMDPEHSATFARILSGQGRQIIMASHREFDGLAADNVIAL